MSRCAECDGRGVVEDFGRPRRIPTDMPARPCALCGGRGFTSSTFDVAALERAMATVKNPPPMTVVHSPHMMKGKAWQMMEDGHLYAFIHSDDLTAIPAKPAASLYVADVPVRAFDDDMRAVFVRGLKKLAAAQPLPDRTA